MNFPRRAGLYAEYRLTEADAMRKLTFGMNLSLDGYIAAPGDDLGWSVPSDELFQWWSDRVGAWGGEGGEREPPPRPRPPPGGGPPRGRFAAPPAAGGTCRRWCSPRRP